MAVGEWEILARELSNENDRLRQDLLRVETILGNSVNRDRDAKDTAIMLAHIASNAIYWRDREIEDFKQWLLEQTGTVDLKAASAEIARAKSIQGQGSFHPVHNCDYVSYRHT